MTIRKTSKIWIAVALIVMLACSVVGLFAVNANATTETFTFSSELKASYKVNDVLEVPSATIGDVEADFRIILPSGVYSEKETLSLTTPGSYTIEYSAVVGGKVYKTQKTFIVSGNLFTINGLGTSQYKTFEDTGISGEMFTLYSGDSIVYNDVIDLTKLSGPKDNLFKLSPIVSTIGEADFSRYEITLTDAYDDSNYVTIRVNQSDGGDSNNFTISYVNASFNGGKYCGLTPKQPDWQGNEHINTGYYVDGLKGMKKTIYYDETKARPKVEVDRPDAYCSAFIDNARYGAAIMGSLTGGTVASPQNSGKQWIGVTYDYETNIVYVSCQSYRMIVADLENADIFGEKFMGFTNNKVKLSIKPTVYTKGSCNLFFQEFAGQKVTEDILDAFVPSYEPEIDIDFGEYDENNIPNVRKGDTYQLFDATAYDLVDGFIPVKTTVYYGYNNANKIQVQVKDGAFTAKHLGEYTVVYSVTNSSGVTVEKLITINSENNDQPLGVSITGEPDYSVSASAGVPVKVLDSYQIENAYGNGKVDIYAVLKSDDSVRFDLDENNDYTFTPIVSGEYDIVYLVSDYSATTTVIRTINVIASDKVYYVIDGVFPEYLIKNGIYDLNIINSFTLDTGSPVEQSTLLNVGLQSGGLFQIDGVMQVSDDFIVNGKVKLVYSPDVSGIDESVYFTKEIPVIDAGLYTDNMNKSAYLISTKGEFAFNSNDTFTTCDVTSFEDGAARFTFANYLSVNPFKVKLSAFVKGEEFVAFDRLNVYIYDAQNNDNYVLCSLFKTEEGWFVSVNDVKTLKLSNTWGGEDDEFYVNFKAASSEVIINTFMKFAGVTYYGTDAPVTYKYGAKLVVEVIGADGCDGIKLNTLCDVEMDNLPDMAPSIIDYSADSNAGERTIGSIVSLLPFAAYDVFAPYLDLTLQVTLRREGESERDFVYSTEQVRLRNVDARKGYQFVVSEYGTYTIQVSANDSYNGDNNNIYTYSIIVTNYTKPVVEITSKTTNYFVGGKLVMPKFTVDIAEYSWAIIIKSSEGQLFYANEKEEFTFTKAGVYTVTLAVYDANVNITEVSYKVTVR